MSILESIMAERKADAEAAAAAVPFAVLRKQAAGRTHHSLAARLREGGTHIIAEVKKASPSAGLLRTDYRPREIALQYEAAGASGISVLTEPRHFLGSADHLRDVRGAVELPVLRKDFLCDPYQIAEAAAWGADVVLLIVAALDADLLRRLHDEAERFGLEVLAEAHTANEVDAALSLPGALVGVNSRNLKTLQTDLAVARELARRIPTDRLSIAESGIRTRRDVEGLQALGYKGFLVGESLLRTSQPGDTLAALMGR